MYAKIDRGDDLVFRRLRGKGVESGRVMSVSDKYVLVEIDKVSTKIPYAEFLDFE
jgi:ribosomal protein S1